MHVIEPNAAFQRVGLPFKLCFTIDARAGQLAVGVASSSGVFLAPSPKFPFLKNINNLCGADSTLLALAACRLAVGHNDFLELEDRKTCAMVHDIVERAAQHVQACMAGSANGALDRAGLAQLQNDLVDAMLACKVQSTYEQTLCCIVARRSMLPHCSLPHTYTYPFGLP